MPLIKNQTFVDDGFARVRDGDELPGGAVIVSLSRFLSDSETFLARNTPLGVSIASHETPEALTGHLDRLEVIEIEFPKFRDGRGYSSARLLRERHGYQGELRASGDVLRDQWLYMSRCGIDAFEVKPGTRIEDFRAAMAEQTVFYQRASDRHASIFELRHRARNAALSVAAE